MARSVHAHIGQPCAVCGRKITAKQSYRYDHKRREYAHLDCP